MKNFLRSVIAFLLIFLLFSCAPMELQGRFNASFSLTECQTTNDQYQYDFYGDGQGVERNTVSGTVVAFTYTAMNGSLTVHTGNASFTYQYEVEEEDDLNITYSRDGKSENVLLVKK